MAAQANPWRFAGEYLDATGMYKIGQRYYHPGLGRWTQPDPIFDPVDPKLWNPYTYVGNDPINYTDPSGMSPCGNSFLRGAASILGFGGDSGRSTAQEVGLKAQLRFAPTFGLRWRETFRQKTDFFSVKPTRLMKGLARGSLGTIIGATAFNLACKGR